MAKFEFHFERISRFSMEIDADSLAEARKLIKNQSEIQGQSITETGVVGLDEEARTEIDRERNQMKLAEVMRRIELCKVQISDLQAKLNKSVVPGEPMSVREMNWTEVIKLKKAELQRLNDRKTEVLSMLK